MYIKRSVNKPQGMPGKGIQPKDRVTIIDVEDIASFPSRDSAGVVLDGDIVMKPGKYGVTLYVTPGTVELNSNSDGEPDAKGFTPSVKFNHPGNAQEIREHKANWLDKNVIVVVDYCNGQSSDVVGSPCNPAQLAVEYAGSKDGNANTLTYSQVSKGDDIAIYNGTVTLEEPVGTIASGSTALAYAGDGQYLPNVAVTAIESITGGSHGSVVTILGIGTGAAIASSGQFILRGGRAFTASEGSQITLRAYDDGGQSLKWIEQSRYEA